MDFLKDRLHTAADDPVLVVLLGLACQDEGDFGEARRCYEQAIQLDPANRDTYGPFLQALQGERTGAAASLKQELASAVMRNDYQAAIQGFDQLIDLGIPDAEQQLEMLQIGEQAVQLFLMSGNVEACVEIYSRLESILQTANGRGADRLKRYFDRDADTYWEPHQHHASANTHERQY